MTPETKARIEYLQEFLYIGRQVSDNNAGGSLNALIQSTIDYYNDGNDFPMVKYLRDEQSASKSNRYTTRSVVFLLERQLIVIHQNQIMLRGKTRTISLMSNSSKDILKSDFLLSESELNQLLSIMGILNSLCSYTDVRTGSKVITTLPKSFTNDTAAFLDCSIDLNEMRKTNELYAVPSLTLKSNFEETDDEGVKALKDLLFFISDYDQHTYHRLCKIMAYCYTHTVLDKMFVFLGKGRNGKGIVLKYIEMLCMGKAHSMSSMYKHRNSSSSTKESETLDILASKATLVEEEFNFSEKIFNECYKSLVTGGAETGRKLGNNSVTLANQSVFYVATNYFDFSDIQEDDYAFTNRVCFTDFDNKFLNNEHDRALTNVLNNPEQFNFKNVLRLVYDELKDEEELLKIPSQNSKYLKGSIFSVGDEKAELLFANLREAKEQFEGDHLINLAGFARSVALTPAELTQQIKGIEGMSIVIHRHQEFLKLDEATYSREIELQDDYTKYNCHKVIEMNDSIPLKLKEAMRVSILRYECELTFSKQELTDYFVAHPDYEVTWDEEQPFVVYKGNSEPIKEVEVQEEPDELTRTSYENELFRDVANNPETGARFLESLGAPNELKVSVFDVGCYPIANKHFRSEYTSFIEGILSPREVSKEETVKLFPYGINTRQGEIEPSKWFAFDCDDCSNPYSIQPVIDEMKTLGLQCYIQESVSSRMVCSHCGKHHVKFHGLIQCKQMVTDLNYKGFKKAFQKSVSFKLDDNYRYHTIMNVSAYDWWFIKGREYNPVIDIEERTIPGKTISINGRQYVQDRSEYATLEDYLIASGDERAELFLKSCYYGYYNVGNRDDTIFKLTNFLNDSLENYNMRLSCYKEGYQKLRDLVTKHPVAEGKQVLFEKIDNAEIEVH